MPIPLLFRTTDMLKWGAGTGVNLEAEDIDNNFWELWVLLNDLVSEPLEPLEIQSIDVNEDGEMTITLSDGTTTFGPFQLPEAAFNWRGAWEAGIAYARFDIFTAEGSVYLVNKAHTSDSEFDPDAGDLEGPFARAIPVAGCFGNPVLPSRDSGRGSCRRANALRLPGDSQLLSVRGFTRHESGA